MSIYDEVEREALKDADWFEEAYQERAGIREYDGMFRRSVAEKKAREDVERMEK